MPHRQWLHIPMIAPVWLLVFLLAATHLSAQEKVTRILFVFDASGSMAGQWEGQQKFDIARSLLLNAVDSLEASPDHIEIGLRIFGHQSYKGVNDCQDSKLEVPFAHDNRQAIAATLNRIEIQGQTPIAYSLFESLKDFPQDPFAKNVIILITDGLETCDGDPCAVGPLLRKNNISLRPFVIGLGLGEEGAAFFDCVGNFYNADDSESFQEALDIVISQAINTTTAQINLLDDNHQPTETNIEVSLYDNYGGTMEKMYVHAKGFQGQIDTLHLTPVIDYDMVVHTTPPVVVEDLSLTPGMHNILPADVPQGTLTLRVDGFPRQYEENCIIRQSGSPQIIDIQSLNTRKRLLTGLYDLEILTLPILIRDEVAINANEETTLLIPAPGKVRIGITRPGIVSLYQIGNGDMRLFYELDQVDKVVEVDILPGSYLAVFRQHPMKRAALTQTKSFTIYTRTTTTLTF